MLHCTGHHTDMGGQTTLFGFSKQQRSISYHRIQLQTDYTHLHTHSVPPAAHILWVIRAGCLPAALGKRLRMFATLRDFSKSTCSSQSKQQLLDMQFILYSEGQWYYYNQLKPNSDQITTCFFKTQPFSSEVIHDCENLVSLLFAWELGTKCFNFN